MAADQAAGLRRRQAGRQARRVYVVSAAPNTVRRLLEAGARLGVRALMIDAYGRHLARQPQSLFDWRQQLASGQLHTIALGNSEGWWAPGAWTAGPELAVLSARYDWLIFDAPPDAIEALTHLGAGDLLALDVAETSLASFYRLLKTLASHAHAASVVLFGQPAACAHLEAACRRFLGVAYAQKIGNLARETDAIRVLAVRMAGEETGPPAVA